jgi:GNAT superfamily N-acetyltransferase
VAAIDRPSTESDWEEMRAICVETAARPIPAEERDAFGRLWIDPYRRWAPEWAYAARDGGRVVGYLTGCASTAPFLLLSGLFGPRPSLGANLRFPKGLLARLLFHYPAHLHVNVRDGHRGGTGRALMDRFERDAAASGAVGVHAFCGERPVGFYKKLGYEELGRVAVGEKFIYALGKKFV